MPFLKKINKDLRWTSHAKAKMRYYGLSEARVKRVMHTPKRIEEGIATGTIAMLQSAGSKKHPYEIWVMIAETKDKRRVISAWRYPGITKPGQPLPAQIISEIEEINL
jgi:hypothetical protein